MQITELYIVKTLRKVQPTPPLPNDIVIPTDIWGYMNLFRALQLKVPVFFTGYDTAAFVGGYNNFELTLALYA